MKILIVLTSLQTFGATKLVVDSIPLYHKKKISNDVIVLKDKNISLCCKVQQQSDITIYKLTRDSIYRTKVIVYSWGHESIFEINYIYQENLGMQGGYSTSYDNLSTKWNTWIDSVDMPPRALKNILKTCII